MITQKGTQVPSDLAEALEADAQAHQTFEAIRPSCQRSYAAWIEDAKKPETRERRVRRTLELAQEWKERRDNRRQGSHTTA